MLVFIPMVLGLAGMWAVGDYKDDQHDQKIRENYADIISLRDTIYELDVSVATLITSLNSRTDTLNEIKADIRLINNQLSGQVMESR